MNVESRRRSNAILEPQLVTTVVNNPPNVNIQNQPLVATVVESDSLFDCAENFINNDKNKNITDINELITKMKAECDLKSP